MALKMCTDLKVIIKETWVVKPPCLCEHPLQQTETSRHYIAKFPFSMELQCNPLQRHISRMPNLQQASPFVASSGNQATPATCGQKRKLPTDMQTEFQIFKKPKQQALKRLHIDSLQKFLDQPKLETLTVKQPWAGALLEFKDSGKRVENRTWKFECDEKQGRWILLHASKKTEAKSNDKYVQLCKTWPRLQQWMEHGARGAIIGVMHVARVTEFSKLTSKTDWCTGPYCWEIDAIVQLPRPIVCLGKLQLWSFLETFLVKNQINFAA